MLPTDETAHNHLQVKYGSFKEVDEETEELKTDPSADWGSHCLITPRPIHLARISDTESEKIIDSSSHQNTVIEAETSDCIPSVKDLKSRSQNFTSSFPIATALLETNSAASVTHESYSEQSVYKSATEGSVESLDKYETAIRDEELTVSDEKNTKDVFSCHKAKGMETFSEFEKDLRQRSTRTAFSSSNSGSSAHHSNISDYIDREKHYANSPSSSVSEYSNVSTPGSPNITKYKYKGTKGFGHSPRIEYNKRESNTQIFHHSQTSTSNCETVGEPSQFGS